MICKSLEYGFSIKALSEIDIASKDDFLNIHRNCIMMGYFEYSLKLHDQ